jgi:predicted nucleotidyltransferase
MGEVVVEQDPGLDSVVQRVTSRISPLSIRLFGSRAVGRARPESDYDIMIIVPDDYPSGHANTLEAWQLVGDLDVPVDATMVRASVFEARSREVGTLSYEVARRGKVIYERPGGA